MSTTYMKVRHLTVEHIGCQVELECRHDENQVGSLGVIHFTDRANPEGITTDEPYHSLTIYDYDEQRWIECQVDPEQTIRVDAP